MKFLLSLGVLICAVVALFFAVRPASALHRVNVLLGTSPVSVWSWNKTDGSFTVILLPSSVAADSIAYGRYGLEALWKLGFIDKKGGLALSRSLTDVLAVPIPWFVGESESLVATDDVSAYARRMFSWAGIGPRLLGKRVTNMPLSSWIPFWWALRKAGGEDIRIIDFVKDAPVGEEILPDQSVRKFLDTQRLDVLLKGKFEDEAVRGEAITVGVYNTTTTPALGTYAARILTQEGVLVVAVGNNTESEVKGCVVEGSEPNLETRTARVIAELFDCDTTATDVQERADLNVKLGEEFASRFTSGN
jgi:hypothetical protein